MYKQGDHVVHATYGVCIVSEVDARLAFGGAEERSYLVLTPLGKQGGHAYVPIEREDLIRPVISRQDALSLIESIESVETDTYRDNNSRAMEDHFKKLLRENNCSSAVLVAKTMKERIREQEAKKHLPSSVYVRMFDQAEGQLKNELACALGITEDEMGEILASKL